MNTVENKKRQRKLRMSDANLAAIKNLFVLGLKYSDVGNLHVRKIIERNGRELFTEFVRNMSRYRRAMRPPMSFKVRVRNGLHVLEILQPSAWDIGHRFGLLSPNMFPSLQYTQQRRPRTKSFEVLFFYSEYKEIYSYDSYFWACRERGLLPAHPVLVTAVNNTFSDFWAHNQNAVCWKTDDGEDCYMTFHNDLDDGNCINSNVRQGTAPLLLDAPQYLLAGVRPEKEKVMK